MSAAWLRVVLKIKKGKGDGYEKEMVRNSIGMCVMYRYFRGCLLYTSDAADD